MRASSACNTCIFDVEKFSSNFAKSLVLSSSKDLQVIDNVINKTMYYGKANSIV